MEQNASTKKAIVVYATHSGNAELVAEAITDGLCSVKIDTECKRSELTKVEELNNFDLIVLVSSTWNVGQLNENMIRLNDELRKTKVEKPFAIVGLGDSENYDIFCGAADILEETVQTTGGKLIEEVLRLDGPPHSNLTNLKEWGINLSKKF